MFRVPKKMNGKSILKLRTNSNSQSNSSSEGYIRSFLDIEYKGNFIKDI